MIIKNKKLILKSFSRDQECKIGRQGRGLAGWGFAEPSRMSAFSKLILISFYGCSKIQALKHFGKSKLKIVEGYTPASLHQFWWFVGNVWVTMRNNKNYARNEFNFTFEWLYFVPSSCTYVYIYYTELNNELIVGMGPYVLW